VAQNQVIKAMLKSRLVAMYAGSRADHGLEFLAILAIRMQEMVGGTRTPDLYRVNFEVSNPKLYLALPRSKSQRSEGRTAD
jgi:hypothetical protein